MKNKRIIAIIMTACMIALLTACGSGSNDTVATKKIGGNVKDNISEGGEVNKGEKTTVTASSNDSASQSSSASSDSFNGYRFIADKTVIELDADCEPVVAKLGEAASYFESVSCAFNGIDKIYTYAHFELQTYPADDGVDRISTIVLFDDMYETEEGITIGSTKEAVMAAYGISESDGSNQIVTRKGNDRLQFIFSAEDKVISVQYTSHVLDAEQN